MSTHAALLQCTRYWNEEKMFLRRQQNMYIHCNSVLAVFVPSSMLSNGKVTTIIQLRSYEIVVLSHH